MADAVKTLGIVSWLVNGTGTAEILTITWNDNTKSQIAKSNLLPGNYPAQEEVIWKAMLKGLNTQSSNLLKKIFANATIAWMLVAALVLAFVLMLVL